MRLLKIARLGHPILRQTADRIHEAELLSNPVQQLIDDMIETMRDSDGVGLAAPQIHTSKQIIVVEIKGDNPRYPHQQEVPLKVILNPKVVSHSQEAQEGWEGCLSIPDLRGQVPRWHSIKVEGQDRNGELIKLDAVGFLARVIQHEIDHLDGIVFLDRMSDFSTLTHLREFQKYWSQA